MNLNSLINDCRTVCLTGNLEQFWSKCNQLNQSLSSSVENDQMVNVAITQVDSIINDNDPLRHAPFNLGLLLIRSNLETNLRVDNHEDQSTDFYINHLNLFFEAPQDQYAVPMSQTPDTIVYLNSLFDQLRPHLFKKPDAAFALVKNGIRWMQQTNANQLTPLHSHLCILVLKCGNSEQALEVLTCDLNSIHPCLTDSKQFLLFYYYGAIIFGMRQEWDKMHFFLEQVISIPAHYVSQIIIDAYKKYGCCDFCLADINYLDFCWFA
jgi:hypothetical protein